MVQNMEDSLQYKEYHLKAAQCFLAHQQNHIGTTVVFRDRTGETHL
jgi:hypothetical protein